MAAPKANVIVVTEVGYCPFCQRTRNLRREERHLGQLVRTTLDCESCHRTLSSTIGPPQARPEPEPQPEPVKAAEPEPAKTKPAAKKPAARKPAATAKKTASATKASTTKKSATKKK